MLAVTLGVLWTALIASVLPRPSSASMGMASGAAMNRLMQTVASQVPIGLGSLYATAFAMLGLMTALGIGWECLYTILQSLRKEGDWPPLISLASGVLEGCFLWIVAHLVGIDDSSLLVYGRDFEMFLIQFSTTWLVMWAATLGPLRVLSVQWHLAGMKWHSSRKARIGQSLELPRRLSSVAKSA
jgi:hypothetical protein